MIIRYLPSLDDINKLHHLLSATQVFTPQEIAVCIEMLDDTLNRGSDKTGYYYLFLDAEDNTLTGFACYGKNSMTQYCWDYYWLAVNPLAQGKGYAQRLTHAVCNAVVQGGGHYVFAESSSMPESLPIRNLWDKTGFTLMANIPDFYKPNDAKIIYRKTVG